MTTLIIVLGVWLAVALLGIWVANHNPDELHDLAAQAKTGQVQAPRKGRRDAPILEPYSQYPGDMPVTYDPKYAPTRSPYEVPVVESFFDSTEYRAFVGGRDQRETPKPTARAPYHRPEPHVYQQAPYWSPERERAAQAAPANQEKNWWFSRPKLPSESEGEVVEGEWKESWQDWNAGDNWGK